MSNMRKRIFKNLKSKCQISNNFIGNWKLDIGYWKFRGGFTLIELLVVITISAIVMGLTTASYLTFERNQKLKNAAATLKNDLRFVQSKAATGDKSTSNCTSTPSISRTLVGWYITVGVGWSSYSINSDCRGSVIGEEYLQRLKTVDLPSGVVIGQRVDGSFDCDLAPGIGFNILFEPLKTGVTFHRAEAGMVPFYLNTNPPTYAQQACAGQDLNIVLKEVQSGARWKVTVKSSGDINDAKI